jgi:PPK2 family polyphosphate:nucleotide phosphotransferase
MIGPVPPPDREGHSLVVYITGPTLMAKIRTDKFAEQFRITGPKFRMKDIDASDTLGLNLKDQAQELLRQGIQRLASLQERMYAQDRWALLLIFQALDAAGKDGTIKHVMSGVNPQGCQVSSFKQPSSEDLDHDFLWRSLKHLPERGRIGIFNRSYYEEVLVVRVHPELLSKQRIPERLVSKNVWQDRFRHIRQFEDYLTDQGTVVRKFFLHVSKKEQRRRFMERLDLQEKNWKFSTADVHEREHFGDYMDAYEDMIRHTATKSSPWYVVPADHKWFTRLVVADAVIDALELIKPSFPKLDDDKLRELTLARAALEAEPGANKKDKNKNKKGKGKKKGNEKGEA